MIKRRRFLNIAASGLSGFALAYLLESCGNQSRYNTENNAQKTSSSLDIKTKVLRMGYQSAGDFFRNQKLLEKRLEPLGVKVEWAQFVQPTTHGRNDVTLAVDIDPVNLG